MSIVVEVAEGLAAWSYENTTLAAGAQHEITDVSPGALAALAAAAAAGSLRVVAGDVPADAVESDELSLEKYETAHAARGPLYAERDREILAAPAKVAADNPDLNGDELRDAQAAAVDLVIERWEPLLDEAAQAALEEVA